MSEFTKDIEDYFCKFTFGQFVTLILFELVTLFFVFYLGARYGPDLIGSRREVAKKSGLPSDSPKTIDEIVGSPQVDYTFPEVLTDPSPPGGKPAKAEAIRIKPSGVTVEEFERQRHDKKSMPIPVEQPPPEAPEAVAPVAKADGKYAVQVGSYPTAEEATRIIDRWKKKGYEPFMSVGEIPNRGTWYRVRLGSFGTRDEASHYLEELRQKEKVSALVVGSQS